MYGVFRRSCKITVFSLFIFTVSCIYACFGLASSVGTITVTKEKITAFDVPQNGILLVSVYDNERLIDVKLYSGSGEITACVKQDMADSLNCGDTLKAFLWDMKTMNPVGESFCSSIAKLPEEEHNKIRITVNGTSFTATLSGNETAKAFETMLPINFNMKELNGNEKFYYLPESLPADPSCPETIQAGDIMLYGSNCVVLFYETVQTSYSYTKIGHIDDVSGLKSMLGAGTVTVVIK